MPADPSKPGRPGDYAFEDLYSAKLLGTQVRKFLVRRFRDDSIGHWHHRLELFENLSSALDLPPRSRILDLGTQVGTFAIEMARRGHAVTGIDLSGEAIRAAEILAGHLAPKADLRFVKGDVSDPGALPAAGFDAIIGEDIFEHLHDDILRATLRNCFAWLRPGGYLVYHTCPTRYDPLFYPGRALKAWVMLGLVPFVFLPDRAFARMTDLFYRTILQWVWKALDGVTVEEALSYQAHCNLLDAPELERLIAESGFMNLFTKSATLYPGDRRGFRYAVFGRKTCFQRNVYGVAWKPLEELAPLLGREPGAPPPAIAFPERATVPPSSSPGGDR